MRNLLLTIAIICTAMACKEKKAPAAESTKGLPAEVAELAEKCRQYPDSTPLRYALVDAYDSLGMYKEALAQVDSLVSRDSTGNEVWMRKGQLQEKNHDTVGAIISYTRSVNIYPAPDAQLWLANLYAERKSDTALFLVNAVARTVFDSRTLAECDFIAGVYHARKGNVQMASQLFDRCITEDRELMEAYIEKGLLYFDRKQYNEALKIFQVAANVKPTYADAYYYQARCQELMGRTQEAITLYRQALQLDPALKEASTALSRLGAQTT